MRESYRLKKNMFYEQIAGRHLKLALIYQGKKEESYHDIDKALNGILKKITDKHRLTSG